MLAQSKVIGIGIIAAGIIGGVAIIILNHSSQSQLPASVSANALPPAEIVHTADWYVAHPDVLKTDEARCGGNAESIPPAACQNVATAEQTLLTQQLQSAAATNAALAKTPTSKSP